MRCHNGLDNYEFMSFDSFTMLSGKAGMVLLQELLYIDGIRKDGMGCGWVCSGTMS